VINLRLWLPRLSMMTIALAECRQQDLLDIDLKALPVDWAFEKPMSIPAQPLEQQRSSSRYRPATPGTSLMLCSVAHRTDAGS
jgi:hypothetical protein